MLAQTNEFIIFENDYIRFEISSKDSRVISIITKNDSKNISGNDTHFFSLIADDKKTQIFPDELTVNGQIIAVKTCLGDFFIEVKEDNEYFTFELKNSLPGGVYKLILAHARYDYDHTIKENCGAVGISMTYWTDPCFFPDPKQCETKAEITAYLKDTGAKYALIVAPISKHREIIKKVCLSIDRSVGICTLNGGAWGDESLINYGSASFAYDASFEFLQKNISFYKALGVNQLDFHKGSYTFKQGDFSYTHYNSHEDFKNKAVKFLKNHGISSGLHTYSTYIDYSCDSILSDPECQKDLGVIHTFTLAEDITADADFIPTLEATDEAPGTFNFFTRSSIFLLIDEEMIEFQETEGGFIAKKRGAVSTNRVPHKKGTTIKHIDGYYHGVAPVLGSRLFFKIAQNTAKAFNEGGYDTIYLDALDGIRIHCEHQSDKWFYMAAFICEVIKYCDREPMFEASCVSPVFWACRGRFGAYDPARRCYKKWATMHNERNKTYTDVYGTTTLGWYDFYPVDNDFPGNVHTKYHHTDAIHYLGSLAITSNSSMVYVEVTPDIYNASPALQRNISLYQTYDNLRKNNYFSEEIIQKVKNSKHECHIRKTHSDEFIFVEKSFQTKKIGYCTNDGNNTAVFENPFDSQTPFIRIEAGLSTDYSDGQVLLELNEELPLNVQNTECVFNQTIDLSDKLANTVSIQGNGMPGSAIAIRLQYEAKDEDSICSYYIDTDFVGRRDFVLIESENGERPDLPFDDLGDEWETSLLGFSIYRSKADHSKAIKISVLATPEATGTQVGSITARKHIFTTIKNPAVTIGNTSVVFECELSSTDYIEFDGNTAKITDRYGNEKEISYKGEIIAENGSFSANFSCDNDNTLPVRTRLTLGFTGKDII